MRRSDPNLVPKLQHPLSGLLFLIGGTQTKELVILKTICFDTPLCFADLMELLWEGALNLLGQKCS